ncbi:titin homolog [Uloborus diversus]|uniref:titin homolog n=1 Tax=Uloborus diversus TaxID=327109 RepID=UPI0024092CDB|nr:titin homolog [Uloborus diversus]
MEEGTESDYSTTGESSEESSGYFTGHFTTKRSTTQSTISLPVAKKSESTKITVAPETSGEKPAGEKKSDESSDHITFESTSKRTTSPAAKRPEDIKPSIAPKTSGNFDEKDTLKESSDRSTVQSTASERSITKRKSSVLTTETTEKTESMKPIITPETSKKKPAKEDKSEESSDHITIDTTTAEVSTSKSTSSLLVRDTNETEQVTLEASGEKPAGEDKSEESSNHITVDTTTEKSTVEGTKSPPSTEKIKKETASTRTQSSERGHQKPGEESQESDLDQKSIEPKEELGEETGQEPEKETGQERGEEPDDEPGQETGEEPGQETGQESDEETGQESGQEPGQEKGEEPEEETEQETGQEPKAEPGQESGKEPGQESGKEPVQESGKEPGQESGKEPEEEADQIPSMFLLERQGHAENDTPKETSVNFTIDTKNEKSTAKDKISLLTAKNTEEGTPTNASVTVGKVRLVPKRAPQEPREASQEPKQEPEEIQLLPKYEKPEHAPFMFWREALKRDERDASKKPSNNFIRDLNTDLNSTERALFIRKTEERYSTIASQPYGLQEPAKEAISDRATGKISRGSTIESTSEESSVLTIPDKTSSLTTAEVEMQQQKSFDEMSDEEHSSTKKSGDKSQNKQYQEEGRFRLVYPEQLGGERPRQEAKYEEQVKEENAKNEGRETPKEVGSNLKILKENPNISAEQISCEEESQKFLSNQSTKISSGRKAQQDVQAKASSEKTESDKQTLKAGGLISSEEDRSASHEQAVEDKSLNSGIGVQLEKSKKPEQSEMEKMSTISQTLRESEETIFDLKSSRDYSGENFRNASSKLDSNENYLRQEVQKKEAVEGPAFLDSASQNNHFEVQSQGSDIGVQPQSSDFVIQSHDSIFGAQNENSDFDAKSQSSDFGFLSENYDFRDQSKNFEFEDQYKKADFGDRFKISNLGVQSENSDFGVQFKNPDFIDQSQKSDSGTRPQTVGFGDQFQKLGFGAQSQNLDFRSQPQNSDFGAQLPNSDLGAQSQKSDFEAHSQEFDLGIPFENKGIQSEEFDSGIKSLSGKNKDFDGETERNNREKMFHKQASLEEKRVVQPQQGSQNLQFLQSTQITGQHTNKLNATQEPQKVDSNQYMDKEVGEYFAGIGSDVEKNSEKLQFRKQPDQFGISKEKSNTSSKFVTANQNMDGSRFIKGNEQILTLEKTLDSREKTGNVTYMSGKRSGEENLSQENYHGDILNEQTASKYPSEEMCQKQGLDCETSENSVEDMEDTKQNECEGVGGQLKCVSSENAVKGIENANKKCMVEGGQLNCDSAENDAEEVENIGKGMGNANKKCEVEGGQLNCDSAENDAEEVENIGKGMGNANKKCEVEGGQLNCESAENDAEEVENIGKGMGNANKKCEVEGGQLNCESAENDAEEVESTNECMGEEGQQRCDKNSAKGSKGKSRKQLMENDEVEEYDEGELMKSDEDFEKEGYGEKRGPGRSGQHKPAGSGVQKPGGSFDIDYEEEGDEDEKLKLGTPGKQRPGGPGKQKPGDSSDMDYEEECDENNEKPRPGTRGKQRPSPSDEQRPGGPEKQKSGESSDMDCEEEGDEDNEKPRSGTPDKQRPSPSDQQRPGGPEKQKPGESSDMDCEEEGDEDNEKPRSDTPDKQRPSPSDQQRPGEGSDMDCEEEGEEEVEKPRPDYPDKKKPRPSDQQRPGGPGKQKPGESSDMDYEEEGLEDVEKPSPGGPGNQKPGESPDMDSEEEDYEEVEEQSPGAPDKRRPGHSSQQKPGYPGQRRPGYPDQQKPGSEGDIEFPDVKENEIPDEAERVVQRYTRPPISTVCFPEQTSEEYEVITQTGISIRFVEAKTIIRTRTVISVITEEIECTALVTEIVRRKTPTTKVYVTYPLTTITHLDRIYRTTKRYVTLPPQECTAIEEQPRYTQTVKFIPSARVIERTRPPQRPVTIIITFPPFRTRYTFPDTTVKRHTYIPKVEEECDTQTVTTVGIQCIRPPKRPPIRERITPTTIKRQRVTPRRKLTDQRLSLNFRTCLCSNKVSHNAKTNGVLSRRFMGSENNSMCEKHNIRNP